MFNRIEFSDLYRFLTSIGVVVIALSFLLPWLYSNSNSSHITCEEYLQLTQASKYLVDKQIELNTLVISAIPFITPTLLLLGIAISTIGLIRWKKKQDAIDETDRINLENLRLDQLNKVEIKEKAEDEVKEDIIETRDETSENPTLEVNYDTLSQDLMKLESQFYEKIVDYNTFDYEPISNVKIDDKYRVDILLRSFDLKKKTDVLIEIKYLQRGLSMQLVRNAHNILRKSYGKYFSKTRRHASLILIVVYKSDVATEDQINRFLKAIGDFKNQGSRFQLFVMRENEVPQFDITKIL